jgi:hypothetical protein
MTFSDQQLKQALAKMLPETVGTIHHRTATGEGYYTGQLSFYWKHNGSCVLDTELLHLCWLVEEGLSYKQQEGYSELLFLMDEDKDWMFIVAHATWQQRTIALAKVKGVEIV